MKKNRVWKAQEDQLLLDLYHAANSFQRWKLISQEMKQKGINKSQLQCRERFFNKLNPNLRHDRVEAEELQAIFNLYNEYGSLWSVFETLIPGRNQNMIKNKFYSTLRSLVRLLLLCGCKNLFALKKLPTLKISSKVLVQIYDGKKDFKKFKGLLPRCLKMIEYDLDERRTQTIKSEIEEDVLRSFISKLQKLNLLKGDSKQIYEINEKQPQQSPLKIDNVKEEQKDDREKGQFKQRAKEKFEDDSYSSQWKNMQGSNNIYPFQRFDSLYANWYPMWTYVYPSVNPLTQI